MSICHDRDIEQRLYKYTEVCDIEEEQLERVEDDYYIRRKANRKKRRDDADTI